MYLINSKTDIVMLGMMRSSAETGIYDIVIKISLMVEFTLMAINIVLAPNFSSLYTTKQMDRLQLIVTRSIRYAFLGAVGLALLIFSFRQPLLLFFG